MAGECRGTRHGEPDHAGTDDKDLHGQAFSLPVAGPFFSCRIADISLRVALHEARTIFYSLVTPVSIT
jgi:hypothetical protein